MFKKNHRTQHNKYGTGFEGNDAFGKVLLGSGLLESYNNYFNEATPTPGEDE